MHLGTVLVVAVVVGRETRRAVQLLAVEAQNHHLHHVLPRRYCLGGNHLRCVDPLRARNGNGTNDHRLIHARKLGRILCQNDYRWHSLFAFRGRQTLVLATEEDLEALTRRMVETEVVVAYRASAASEAGILLAQLLEAVVREERYCLVAAVLSLTCYYCCSQESVKDDGILFYSSCFHHCHFHRFRRFHSRWYGFPGHCSGWNGSYCYQCWMLKKTNRRYKLR